MKLRAIAVIVALAAAFLAVPCFAQTHFALATSRSSIFLLRQGSTWSAGQSAVTLFTGGSGLSEVAVHGNWVFAADGTSGKLIVGRLENVLTSPSLSHVQSIDLGITKPTSVAVDVLTGGVYVTGSDDAAPKYAYVTPAAGDWTGTINVSTVALDSTLRDVASLGSGGGAIIASDKTVPSSDGDLPQRTHVTTTAGSAPGTTYRVNGTQDPSYPSAIAALAGLTANPLAYVTSHVGQAGTGIYGTLEVVDSAGTGAALASIKLNKNLDPWDVTTFTIGTTNYLAIIGVPRGQSDNSAQAWKVALNSEGLPTGVIDAVSYVFSGETLGEQKCAVSSDGAVFWSTHPGMNGVGATVSALSTSNWLTQLADFSITSTYGIANVAAYNYVPEPPAVATLVGLVGILVAQIKRRKR